MKLIKIIITCLIILITSSTKTCFAAAEVKTYRFEEEITLNGVVSSSTKYFSVENNMEVTDASINLIFTKSELLDPTLSSITIYLNNTPISSINLSRDKKFKDEMNIVLPVELIQSGYNVIKITAFKTITDQLFCSDDNTNGNWLVLHEESTINLQYEQKKYEGYLSQYTDIFLTYKDGQKLNTSIAIPDIHNSTELTAGFITSSDIGKRIKYNNYHFDLLPFSDVNKDHNLIYIGKKEHTSQELLNLLTPEELNSLTDNALIKMVDSPYHAGSKLLIILSEHDDLLIKATQFMSSDRLLEHLHTNTMLINSKTVLEEQTSQTSNVMTFKQLGYENMLLQGPFTQEVSIDLHSPKSKVVVEGTKIKLNFKYAENLDFNRSLVTVYVNGVPVGSQKLALEHSQEDTLEIRLPDEVLGKNYYQIKVVFNLDLLDLQCVTRDMDTPWAYILPDSSIDFVYTDNQQFTFTTYPYPFINDEVYNDLTIVLPNDPSNQVLTNMANIMSYMGHDLSSTISKLRVIKANEFTSDYYEDQLILLGTPDTNPIIKEQNESLNIKFKDDFSGFISTDMMSFTDKFASEIASIQLVQSPFSTESKAMIITSTNDADLQLSTKYLSDLSLTRLLTGDTILIDRNGHIEDLRIQTHPEDSKNEKDEVIIEDNSDVMTPETIQLLVVSLVLVISVSATAFFIMKRHKS